MKYAMFIGRWQPLHNGHDYIIRQMLDRGKLVFIAVRDTPQSEEDPFTVGERIEMICQHYKPEVLGGSRIVGGIPDIESVNIGRGVGYEINFVDAPVAVEAISSTRIRQAIVEGDDHWKQKVPSAIAAWIEARRI